jgi:hypothetical protein
MTMHHPEADEPLFLKVNQSTLIPISRIDSVDMSHGEMRVWCRGCAYRVEYNSTRAFILSAVAGRFPAGESNEP